MKTASNCTGLLRAEWGDRLDEADHHGFTWDDIGGVLGVDAVRAAVEHHAIGHGPEP